MGDKINFTNGEVYYQNSDVIKYLSGRRLAGAVCTVHAQLVSPRITITNGSASTNQAYLYFDDNYTGTFETTIVYFVWR